MDYDEFIGRVRYQARLSSGADAERACRATLESLREWVPGPLAGGIAAQLPREIGHYLRPPEASKPAEANEADQAAGADEADDSGQPRTSADFVGRVAYRAGVGDDQAASIAHAVIDVLEAATEGGLMAQVTEGLPPGLREYVTPPPGQERWEGSGGWVGPVVGRGGS